MTKKILIISIITLLLSCSAENESSVIEIIKYDPEVVAAIQSNYYSTYIENPKRKDFWSIEHYIVDPEKENLIFKDSLNNVVGIVKRQDGKNYYTSEYYPNGQLKRKVEYSEPGIIDGPSIGYYQDGRISSIGEWKDFKKVGEWKNYNPDGKLESIDYYVNGKLDHVEQIKN